MIQFLKTVILSLITLGLFIPNTVMMQPASDTIYVNGSVWIENVAKGSDICELVRDEFGSCWYISFDEQSDAHYVETADNTIFIESNGFALSEKVPAGADVCEIVRNQAVGTVGTCEYLRFDSETKTHYVNFLPMTFDIVELIDVNNITFASQVAEHGSDHRQVAVNHMDVDFVTLDDVEWVDGYEDYSLGKGDMIFTYRAIVRINTVDTLYESK